MQDRATKSHKLRQAELKQMKDTIAASKQKVSKREPLHGRQLCCRE